MHSTQHQIAIRALRTTQHQSSHNIFPYKLGLTLVSIVSYRSPLKLKMTRFNRKKKTPLLNPDNLENAKDNESSIPLATSKALPTSKQTAFRLKPPSVTVAPQAQVGLLVTAELEKAIEECKTKVAQIVKGCRAANRRFR